MKRFLIGLVLILVSACSPSTIFGASKVNDTCANKVALAIISSTPIRGAFACLDPVDQNILKAGTPVVSDDIGLSTHNVSMTYQGQKISLSIASCGGMKSSKFITENQESYEIYPTDPAMAASQEHAVLKLYINKKDNRVEIFYFNHPETCLKAQDVVNPIT